MKTMLSALVITFISSSVAAIECNRLNHEDGQTHVVNSMINNYTHIELPENIMQNTDPIVGNSKLWLTDSAGPHIYIKPTTELKLGQSTSLSAVGMSGKSYDFKVYRKKNVKSNCYRLVDGLIFSSKQRKALTLKRPTDTSSVLASLWREKYMTEKKNTSDKIKSAVLKALRRYRHNIYTRYTWDQGSGFIGKNLISDIYDDGRFTFIRVYNYNKGLMMVEATLSGQTEMVHAKFDPLTKLYMIAGIFPEFKLKYSDSTVEVGRADNTTQGAY